MTRAAAPQVVLLVTGARSLASRPGAEAWARGLIHAAMRDVSLLIVGDAEGPDEWAWDTAALHVRHRWKFNATGGGAGWIYQHDDGAGFVRTTMERVRWIAEGQSTHPLNRNRMMVATARAHMLRGHDVTALALIDGTKRDAPGRRATRGTEHTAALAERAGIVVTRRTWPEGGS